MELSGKMVDMMLYSAGARRKGMDGLEDFHRNKIN
jgi:hypothetical protein